jgi:hypothetical protein
METASTENSTSETTVISVKPLISKLINTILPKSIAHRNLLINDVPPELQIPVNENKLALVIGNLINNIISVTYNDCIRIDAAQNGKIAVRLRNTDLSQNQSFIVSLETILVIAERFGITLKLEEFYGKGTDVSVCFLKAA